MKKKQPIYDPNHFFITRKNACLDDTVIAKETFEHQGKHEAKMNAEDEELRPRSPRSTQHVPVTHHAECYDRYQQMLELKTERCTNSRKKYSYGNEPFTLYLKKIGGEWLTLLKRDERALLRKGDKHVLGS